MGEEAQDASSRCWAVWLLRPYMQEPGIMNPLLWEERTGPGGADARWFIRVWQLTRNFANICVKLQQMRSC